MANLYRAANEIDATLNKIMLIGEVIELQLMAIANGEYPPTPQEVIDDGEPEDFVLKNFDYNELLNRAIATALSMENTYAEGGQIDKNYINFLNSLPDNLKNTDPSKYNMYRYWELNGKPDNFIDSINRPDPLFTLENDRRFHASSVAYDAANDRYEFMKAPLHDTTDMELLQYFNSDDMSNFRKDWKLNMDTNPYLYERRKKGDVNLFAEGGDTNLLNNQDFLNQYGIHWDEDPLMNDYYAQHPSELNKPTTAGMPAAYNDRVLVNRYGVPQSQTSLNRYARDYALVQPQVSRKEEREVEKAQGDRRAEYMGNGLTNMLTLGWLRPSLWVGMFAENSDRPYLERLFAGTTGLMQDELWIKEHPYLSEMLNIGFDLITGDLSPTGRMMFNDAANRYPALVQYPRYYYGKYVKYPGTELPTIYRKFKGTDITTEGNNIVLTRTPSRFAYETTGADPQITNMTTDIPVLSHGDGNWDIGATLATKGKNLLKYKVTSTRPSDTFTVGLKIKVPKKNTVVISGDIDELNALNDNGIKTVTNDKLQAIHDKAEMEFNQNQNQRFNLGKPDYSKYAREVQSVTRDMFRSPTAEDYQLMDYVFRPMYESQVAPTYMRDIYLSDMYNAPEWFTDIWSNSARRRRLGNLDGNVIYDPMTQVDDIYRRERGIGLLRDIPLSVQLLWNTNK